MNNRKSSKEAIRQKTNYQQTVSHNSVNGKQVTRFIATLSVLNTADGVWYIFQ